MLDKLEKLFKLFDVSYLFEYSTVLTLIIMAFLIVRKIRTERKYVLFALLFILAVRLILFWNPVSWLVYSHFLSIDDVGFRQYHVILFESNRYLKKPKQVEFLAVGSSQTRVIYYKYSLFDSKVTLFTMAALGPLDYWLYREQITSYHPKTVLLFLSEFDMARKPIWTAMRWAPQGGWDSLKLYWKVREFKLLEEAQGPLWEMLAGAFLPEYKYSFVFRDLVDRLLNRRLALGLRGETKIGDEESLRRGLELLKRLREDGIAFHLAVLEDFIRYCAQEDINIVILEGQYNPLAYSEENLRLNLLVRERLAKLARQHSNVQYVPKAAIQILEKEDYRDGYHVTEDVGFEFAKKVITFLRSNGPF